MVKSIAVLPSEENILSLSKITSPVSIFQRKGLIAAPTEVVLKFNKDETIKLSIAYSYVVFKFECFGLEISKAPPEPFSKMEPVGEAVNWQNIKCLFRYEWEQPARSGELQPNWEQVVRGRGKHADIPQNAIAVGVSLVGLVFGALDEKLPVFLIACNDDDPATFRFYKRSEEIKVFINECECIELNEVLDWYKKLDSLFVVS